SNQWRNIIVSLPTRFRANPWTRFRNGLSTRFRAMQHRNFQLFIAGQLTSLVGTWMQTTAQLWLVYRLTGSAALQVPLVHGMVTSSNLPHRTNGGILSYRYPRDFAPTLGRAFATVFPRASKGWREIAWVAIR